MEASIRPPMQDILHAELVALLGLDGASLGLVFDADLELLVGFGRGADECRKGEEGEEECTDEHRGGGGGNEYKLEGDAGLVTTCHGLLIPLGIASCDHLP
jgi:hypothetical protein